MEVKYPNVKVQLSEEDGNAFSIIGRVRRALLKGGVAPDQIEEYCKEAMSGDYDHLLQTTMKWVDVS